MRFLQNLRRSTTLEKYSDKWREEYMFQEVHDQDMIIKGRREGRKDAVLELVRDGDITIERAAEKLDISLEEAKKRLEGLDSE